MGPHFDTFTWNCVCCRKATLCCMRRSTLSQWETWSGSWTSTKSLWSSTSRWNLWVLPCMHIYEFYWINCTPITLCTSYMCLIDLSLAFPVHILKREIYVSVPRLRLPSVLLNQSASCFKGPCGTWRKWYMYAYHWFANSSCSSPHFDRIIPFSTPFLWTHHSCCALLITGCRRPIQHQLRNAAHSQGDCCLPRPCLFLLCHFYWSSPYLYIHRGQQRDGTFER